MKGFTVVAGLTFWAGWRINKLRGIDAGTENKSARCFEPSRHATDCWLASGREANREGSQTEERSTFEETEIENDFQKECRKGAKFAAHTAFSVILGEISCLFSLALEFFTRFRGGSFQPLTHLSGNSCQLSAISSQRKATANGGFLKKISTNPPHRRARPHPPCPIYESALW